MIYHLLHFFHQHRSNDTGCSSDPPPSIVSDRQTNELANRQTDATQKERISQTIFFDEEL